MYINGKTNDLCSCEYKGREIDDYVPDDIGLIDGGDYIEMKYCLECGQIQGQWPIPEPDTSKWDEI
jgi:hypothetical protein